MILNIPLIYWNTADLVFHWHWNYLPERASCDLENNKNSQGARHFKYMVCGSSKAFSFHLFLLAVSYYIYINLNAVTCIMYNAHKLTHHSSEYTVYLWICKVYSLKRTFYTLASAANSLHCSKKVFQMPQVFVNFLELRFLYATSFSTSYFWCRTKRSSIVLGFFSSSNKYKDIALLLEVLYW